MRGLDGLQVKASNLGADVKPDSPEVTQTRIDIHEAACTEVEFAAGVPAILHGQNGRGKKGRFALSTVSVPGEHPTFGAVPEGQIHHIRVVAQSDCRLLKVDPANRALEIEVGPPEVVDAQKLQAVRIGRFIAEHSDPRVAQALREPIGNIAAAKARAIVVIAKCRKASKLRRLEAVNELGHSIDVLASCARHEVAREDDIVGIERANPIDAI